ncbi:MAG: type II secretion system GspH family protein [Verrucomicrobiae bacterium]|nr:type II secretion system GspH family protein [Verrucomicrobiae bacterium]NNJ41805.1 type II secretion system protein [Akkermansiaceae bacterium]
MKVDHRSQGIFAPAFTLIEVLVVIAIIAVLATIVAGGLGWSKRKVAESSTRVLVQSLSRGLEEFSLDNGVYPEGDGSEDSSELLYMALFSDGGEINDASGEFDDTPEPDGQADSGRTVYLPELDPNKAKPNTIEDNGSYRIIDAWKAPIFYRHDPEGNDLEMMNPDSDFDLWSLGPDGEGGPGVQSKETRDDITNYK